ncbi:hypothetical protein DMH27_24495 [Raoultella planticola]|nr:hypothetical protein [Raoultella planticola]
MRAALDSGCHTLITMPGASKFYRSSWRAGPFTSAPDAGGTLDAGVVAAGRDFLPGARASLHTAFHLCASSTLLAWDLCLGRPVIGENFSHGALSNRLEVWMDDAPPLIERLHRPTDVWPAWRNTRGSVLCCSIPPAKPCLTACGNDSQR